MLNNAEIEYHLNQTGKVIIYPFDKRSLGPNSYDVRLGTNYYRQVKPTIEDGPMPLFNPYSERSVRKVWGPPQLAAPAYDVLPAGCDTDGIFEDDLVIMLAPGEIVLCHTEEFIGGREDITSMMKARSSYGRSCIEVCKCAGLGDLDYFNIWTMEVTNNSPYYWLPLVARRRVAQITLFLTGLTALSDNNFTGIPTGYLAGGGKYQITDDLDVMRANWKPDAMLPRLYMDREIRERRLAVDGLL